MHTLFDIALIILACSNVFYLHWRTRKQAKEIEDLWEVAAKFPEANKAIIERVNTNTEHIEKILDVLIERNFLYAVAKKKEDEA